jgi:hypothetical protein
MRDETEPERQARQIDRVHAEAGRTLDGAAEAPLAPDIPPDRTRQFRYVNFSRMRLEWTPSDRIKMEEIDRVVWNTIRDRFLGAFDLMDRIWMLVRKPVVEDEKIVTDKTGRPVWRLNEAGFPIEDWTMLRDSDRDGFLWEVSTHLFIWEQDAAKIWGDAMFAKGIWEGEFAKGFTEPAGRLTIDDRTQLGHLAAMEDRYFAIFQSVLSRRADAVIRSMRQIERRLARE